MMNLWAFLSLLLAGSTVLAADDLPMQQLAFGLYVHIGREETPDTVKHGASANIGFIAGKRCVAVIDSGGNPDQGRKLKAAIKKVTDKPICYVINTHVHPDHIYGNSAFVDTKASFVGHRNLARAIEARGPFYIDKAGDLLGLKLTDADLIRPDIEVNERLILDLGERPITLVAYQAAHTDNDLTVFDIQSNTLWASDLVFGDHIPVIDGSLQGWLQVLEALSKHSYKQAIPGHGPIPVHWLAALNREKGYLLALQSDIRRLLKKGGALEDALKSAGYSEPSKWSLFDQHHRKNISTAFAELEGED